MKFRRCCICDWSIQFIVHNNIKKWQITDVPSGQQCIREQIYPFYHLLLLRLYTDIHDLHEYEIYSIWVYYSVWNTCLIGM